MKFSKLTLIASLLFSTYVFADRNADLQAAAASAFDDMDDDTKIIEQTCKGGEGRMNVVNGVTTIGCRYGYKPGMGPKTEQQSASSNNQKTPSTNSSGSIGEQPTNTQTESSGKQTPSTTSQDPFKELEAGTKEIDDNCNRGEGWLEEKNGIKSIKCRYGHRTEQEKNARQIQRKVIEDASKECPIQRKETSNLQQACGMYSNLMRTCLEREADYNKCKEVAKRISLRNQNDPNEQEMAKFAKFKECMNKLGQRTDEAAKFCMQHASNESESNKSPKTPAKPDIHVGENDCNLNGQDFGYCDGVPYARQGTSVMQEIAERITEPSPEKRPRNYEDSSSSPSGATQADK